MAVLQWRAAAKEAKKSEARLRSVLSSLSPEGRATRAAWNAWSVLASQQQAIRTAVITLTRRGEVAAFRSWAEAAAARCRRRLRCSNRR